MSKKLITYMIVKMVSSTWYCSAQDIIYVPVVVHVVYSSEAQNVSDDQIRSQIIALNADYRRLNADASRTPSEFVSVAADAQIIFYLATISDAGEETDGVTRTPTTHGVFANDDIHFSELGGRDAWNVLEYLNIWVADLPPGVQGFASTPEGIDDTDGVVIDYESFGTFGTAKIPYHLGRTLTHEVGHYLGLKHPWGTTGGCDDDDGIEDTNNQTGPVTICASNNSCNSPDMVQNFMNLADDECLNFFTKGQASAMRGILSTVREELVNDDKGYSVIAGVDFTRSFETRLHPNPSSDGRVTLTTISNFNTCRVFDVQGRPVPYSMRKVDGSWELRLNEKGTYLVKLMGRDYQTTSKIIYE
ncbi:MAG: zinc-dependent metalloprotease [Bacteroidota bacterium]